MAYNNINENKMMAQTGVDNGLSILKERIITSIKNKGNSDSVLYDIANATQTPMASIINEIGLAADQTTDIHKSVPGNNPQSFPVAFNVFGTPLTTDSAIQYGDCYVEYVDNIKDQVINKNTNLVTTPTDPDKQDLNNYIDPANNIEKKCIKMTVIAVGKKNAIKRIDIYIDKNSISDFYLDKMAANTFTIINKTTVDSTTNSFADFTPNTTDSDNSYYIAGNIYFRGHSFNLNDSSKINIDGTINAKVAEGSSELNFTPSKMTDINGTTEQGIDSPYNQTNDTMRSFQVYLNESDKKIEDKSMIMPFYPPLDDGINYYDSSGSSIDTESNLVNNNDYTLLNNSSINQINFNGTSASPSPFMIIAKCKPDAKDKAVDFNQLVYGNGDRASTTNGLRYFIKYATYRPDNTIEMNGSGNKVFDFPDDSEFAKMFKMIVVYGDLNIDATSYTYDGLLEDNSGIFDVTNYRKLTSVNYFIVCLGTVTIKGPFNMENSSIFAKKVVFADKNENDVSLNVVNPDDPSEDTTSSAITDTSVNISGVGTNKAIYAIKSNLNNYYDSIPNNAWGYLNNIEKAKINEYLINNLPEQYGEGLKFNIIKWDEK
jgi:hypothetical protein